MEPELTPDQAREIARLRRRHPHGELLVHPRPWGLILEARERERTVELEAFTWRGTIEREERLTSGS